MRKKNYRNNAFHRKFGKFTRKLRKLMDENPSLPVVVISNGVVEKGEIDCDIAYVYKKGTEEFTEKIIAIHF